MNTVVISSSLTPKPTGLRGWLQALGKRAWRAMEATGQARAQRHLLDFASQCEVLQPNLANELRAAIRQRASD